MSLDQRLRVFLYVGIVVLANACASKVKVVNPVKEEFYIQIDKDSVDKATVFTPFEIKISAVGDIMVHQTQLRAQIQKDSTYRFNNNFTYLIPYFNQVDIAIGNLETTFAGEDKGYSTYPRFNTPDQLAEALAQSGFDILATANNHLYDRGGEAMLRTIDIVEKNKVDVIGTRKDTLTKNYLIKEIKGVKIGFTAYTYETPKYNGRKTINGIGVAKEYEALINSFDYDALDTDLEQIKQTIESMKKDGATCIVFVIHWGNEYELKPDKHQKYIARQLNSYGVDIVFGSHPHVVQPVEFIKNEENGKLTFVAYSMGNFISNQRFESLQNYHTEDGVMFTVSLQKQSVDDTLKITNVAYEPLWVHRYYENSKPHYEIVPADSALITPENFYINDENTLKRVKDSFDRTTQKIQVISDTTQQRFFNQYLIKK